MNINVPRKGTLVVKDSDLKSGPGDEFWENYQPCSDMVLWFGLFPWNNVTLPTGKIARLILVPFRWINDPYVDLTYDVFFQKWRTRLSDFFQLNHVQIIH